ncbi:MAG TPA: nucleotidyl transferase AbiEii/AbiGii toxin family protein [Usitatibacter sp.]|nr:nucleotidyl transferase AbiEii/AbiGii toxin family protein [Usitatibacter sp.]HUP09958.1 nucleotidyl transferase AbiEii/AbiGii toxin family protein [Caldimonas sp.]
MPKAAFARASHAQVLEVLRRLDRQFLAEARCYFGGGTRIVLELGEYRESRDIDFLCSSRDGYRVLRETVGAGSLGKIVSGRIALAREVRADQYGLRTFLEMGQAKLKFEIVREARIDLEGEDVPRLPVMCLSRKHCFAEKFLANADRGLDASTLSRDIIDLAFMVQGWPQADADAGLSIAMGAYGASVPRSLAAVIRKMGDKAYRNRCIEGLAISTPKVLTAGLKTLGSFV